MTSARSGTARTAGFDLRLAEPQDVLSAMGSLPSAMVECPLCQLNYFPDIPDDRRIHRSRHAEWMKPRRPKPDPRFADNADVVVDKSSPTRLHKLVYERARALQRDEGYGFPQWNPDCPPRRGRGERMHAILLVEEFPRPSASPVSFEYVTWTNTPAGWHLNFAWIAPPWRRKGVIGASDGRNGAQLTGEFTFEQPFSSAMANFLAKQGLAVNEDDLSEGT